jgi:hypothetical protein
MSIDHLVYGIWKQIGNDLSRDLLEKLDFLRDTFELKVRLVFVLLELSRSGLIMPFSKTIV